MEPIELGMCNVYNPDRHDLTRFWLEPKLDGWRAQAVIDERGNVQIYSRTNHRNEDKVPHIVKALKQIDKETILDGELVWFDNVTQAPNFNMTARVMGSGVDKALHKQADNDGRIVYVVFDIPWFAGFDYRKHQIEIRRRALRTVLFDGISSSVVSIPNTDATLHNHEVNLLAYGEGSVLKPKRSIYNQGWLKWKAAYDADVVVLGYTMGMGKFEGLVGAIEFGQYKNGVITSRGQCSGMTDEIRIDVTKRIYALLGHVMVISHMGIAAADGFRHPNFLRFRSDKLATDCLWDRKDGTKG